MTNQLRKCEGFGFPSEDLILLDEFLRSRGLDLDQMSWERRREAFNPIECNGDAALLAGLLNIGPNDLPDMVTTSKYVNEYDIVVRMRDWRRQILAAAIRKAKASK